MDPKLNSSGINTPLVYGRIKKVPLLPASHQYQAESALVIAVLGSCWPLFGEMIGGHSFLFLKISAPELQFLVVSWKNNDDRASGQRGYVWRDAFSLYYLI